MLSRSTSVYGAALSPVGAVLLVAATAKPGRPVVILTAAARSLLGPLAWNAILRATKADTIFVDAPVAVFPVSWQRVRSRASTRPSWATPLTPAGPARTRNRSLKPGPRWSTP